MARDVNITTLLTATTADLATESSLLESTTAVASFNSTAKSKAQTVANTHKKRVTALQSIIKACNELSATGYPAEVILTLTDAEYTDVTSFITAFDVETAAIVNSGA